MSWVVSHSSTPAGVLPFAGYVAIELGLAHCPLIPPDLGSYCLSSSLRLGRLWNPGSPALRSLRTAGAPVPGLKT